MLGARLRRTTTRSLAWMLGAQTTRARTTMRRCCGRRSPDCGGCGLTRAFVQLGHGSLREALRLNLAAPLIFLWCLGMTLEALCLNLAGRKLDWAFPNPWRWRFYGAVLTLLTVLWVVRLTCWVADIPSPI